MTEWENHFNCVCRTKITRRIVQLQKEHDELQQKNNTIHISDKDNLKFIIAELQDLIY